MDRDERRSMWNLLFAMAMGAFMCGPLWSVVLYFVYVSKPTMASFLQPSSSPAEAARFS